MNVMEWIWITVLIIPGIVLMTINEKELYKELLPNDTPPPYMLRLLNHIIVAFPFTVLGLFFYKRADLENALTLSIDWLVILLSLACAFINIVAYYIFLKKNISTSTFYQMERTRKKTWISTRCLYGGIVEEIIFRFGLMSFFIWLLTQFTDQEILSFWIANILASILFALAHLPGIQQKKSQSQKESFSI